VEKHQKALLGSLQKSLQDTKPVALHDNRSGRAGMLFSA
jgi:hypothetical protein